MFLKTLAAELGARIAAEILPANVLARTPDMITWWTRARREVMFFGRADQTGRELNGAIYPHPALVFKVTDRELFVRALEKDERPAWVAILPSPEKGGAGGEVRRGAHRR